MYRIVKYCLKYKIWLALALIIILAFILRIYDLGKGNMWIDESISSIAAREILEKGIPRFDSGLFYGRAIVFHYLMALFISIFNNDFGTRLISVLFGVGTALLAFFIGKEFKIDNKNYVAGLVAALFTGVLFFEVAYSRQARFYQMFQFLFFLTLFLLYKSKYNKKYAWLASLSLLLLVDTHLSGLVIVPLFFYLFYKEQKDWKLFIIPLLVSLYYGPSVLGIGIGNSELIGNYIENYSSTLFYHLRAFSFITLLGLPFAFKLNKRLTFILIIPSAILLFSLIFVKIYALRYAYFIILLAPIFISVLFSFIFNNNRIFFILILVFAILYPSNIFFQTGYLTVIKPEQTQFYTSSEPIIGYKDLSQDVKEKIMSSRNIVLFTPTFSWYYKKPDYFIPFSLNGLPSGYTLYNNVDTYTGAKKFELENMNFKEFLYIEDAFSYSKLSSKERNKLDELKSNCNLLEEARLLKVYNC